MDDYVWHVNVVEPNYQTFVYSNMEDLENALRVFKINAPTMQQWKTSAVGAPLAQESLIVRVEMWYGKKEEQKAKQENSKKVNGDIRDVFSAWPKEH